MTRTVSLENVRLNTDGCRPCGCSFGLMTGLPGLKRGDLICISDYPSPRPLRVSAVDGEAALVEWVDV